MRGSSVGAYWGIGAYVSTSAADSVSLLTLLLFDVCDSHFDYFLSFFLQSKNASSLAGQSFAGKNSLRPEPGPLFGGKLIELPDCCTHTHTHTTHCLVSSTMYTINVGVFIRETGGRREREG